VRRHRRRMANKKRSDKTNKAEFIRRHVDKSPKEVVALGKGMNLKFTERYVRNVRDKMSKNLDKVLAQAKKPLPLKLKTTGYLGEKTRAQRPRNPILAKAAKAVSKRLDEMFWEVAAERIERIMQSSFMPKLATVEVERRLVELAVEIGLTRAQQLLRQAAEFDVVMSSRAEHPDYEELLERMDLYDAVLTVHGSASVH